MAEKYQSQKYKSTLRTRKHTSSQSRSTSKPYKYKSRTPPLPSNIDLSMKDLLDKRKSLKEKLKYLQKSPKIVTPKIIKKSSENLHNITSLRSENKCAIKSGENYCSNINNLDKSEDFSLLDSDEEEHIIAERRQKRKQLLEKLNSVKNEINSIDTHNVILEEDGENNISETCNKTAESLTSDMFSEKDDFDMKISEMNHNKTQIIDECDDSEGYLNIQIGEKIFSNKYTIKSILGQGVFANVVQCVDNEKNINVAIKIIRNNSLMHSTGLKEIKFLKRLNCSDPENKYHCVQFYCDFLHKNHLCLVFESLHMDLRHLLKKYGRNHGISSKALINYSRQLFLALRLLKKNGLVHADIKPDNILVNENKNVLKLCDFGSTIESGDNEVTPYLVSRYYRAPEIILGIPPYTYGIDTWSAACTIYEMATGKIMFTGTSNNKMLKCFMDLKGKIPNKIIRKGKFKDLHFDTNNYFLYSKTDILSGKEKIVEVTHVKITRDLNSELKKTQLEQKKLSQLKDLLNNMLTFDLSKRLSVTDCLKHPFILDYV